MLRRGPGIRGRRVIFSNSRLPLFFLLANYSSHSVILQAVKIRYRISLLPTDNKPQTTYQLLLNHQITKIRKVHGVDDVFDAHILFTRIGMVLPVKGYKGGVIIENFFNFLQNGRALFQIRLRPERPWSAHRSWDCSNYRCYIDRSRFPCWGTSPEIR